jgi:Transglutaminase-like superfamily
VRSCWRPLRRRLHVIGTIRSVADAWLVVRAMVFAAAVPVLMRLPLDKLEWLLGPRRASATSDLTSASRLLRLLDAALELGRPFVGQECLTRGLIRYFFLRQAGVDVTLAFGIGRPGDAVAGHCWLISGGQPVLEKRDPRPVFTEVHRIPKRNAAELAG